MKRIARTLEKARNNIHFANTSRSYTTSQNSRSFFEARKWDSRDWSINYFYSSTSIHDLTFLAISRKSIIVGLFLTILSIVLLTFFIYYKPPANTSLYNNSIPEEGVKVVFGFNIFHKDHCGLMVYHKNRLVLRYHKLDSIHNNNKSSKFMGILCILDTPFLEANPMKNDFLKEGPQYQAYQQLMNWLASSIRLYWRSCKIDISDGGKKKRNVWEELVPWDSRKMENVWLGLPLLFHGNQCFFKY